MTDLSVETQAVRGFAATHEEVAAQVSSAAKFDTVGQVASMTPAFGLIGADYLAMFAAAQVLHSQDINDLAGKVDHLGKSAFASAAVYDQTDKQYADNVGKATGAIGGAPV